MTQFKVAPVSIAMTFIWSDFAFEEKLLNETKKTAGVGSFHYNHLIKGGQMICFERINLKLVIKLAFQLLFLIVWFVICYKYILRYNCE
jgi:hypothetical protein